MRMRAITIVGQGGPEVLRLTEVATPTPGPGQLRIRVHAAGLNRADLLQARGLYPAPPGAPSDIPGLEYSGEVEAVGPDTRRFSVGDRVMGITGGGAFAEFVVVHEDEALELPKRLGYAEGAAVPEAFLTAFDAVVLQGGLQASEVLLVHAATSGVGTAAIQIGHQWGAIVAGTGRSQEKLERCRPLGLSHLVTVTHTPPRFAEALRKSLGRGVDVALDLLGGPYVGETLAVMAPRGRILQVGTLAGAQAPLDLALLMRMRLRLTGTVLRSRSLAEKVALARAFEEKLHGPLCDGRLRPVLAGTLPFTSIEEAFAQMASNATLGKLVLTWD